MTIARKYKLCACAEMLWPDKDIEWRIARLNERSFGVGLWNWPTYDLKKLETLKADFTIMNGYLEGRLADEEGAQALLASARETAEIGKRLGVDKLNLHGTGLDQSGLPRLPLETVSPRMWLKAQETLLKICELAEELNVIFTLENLNLKDHPGCPFNSTEDVLSLVSSVNHPQLRINLDLYHTQVGEGDLIRWIESCLPWLAEVQIADNPGRCEPGTGEVNFIPISNLLSNLGYSGAICLEAYAANGSDSALTTFESIFDGTD